MAATMVAGNQAAESTFGSDAADLIEGDEPESTDPLEELKGMWTLTLEDVRFDEQGPSVEQGGSEEAAMAYIAGKFVLSALLDGTSNPSKHIVDEKWAGIVLPVESVGLKGPGLGLAGTNVERCNVPKPTVVVRPCRLTAAGNTNFWGSEADDLWAVLDRAGFVCGNISGQVCHESGVDLDIEAEFMAARSLEDCIQ